MLKGKGGKQGGAWSLNDPWGDAVEASSKGGGAKGGAKGGAWSLADPWAGKGGGASKGGTKKGGAWAAQAAPDPWAAEEPEEDQGEAWEEEEVGGGAGGGAFGGVRPAVGGGKGGAFGGGKGGVSGGARITPVPSSKGGAYAGGGGKAAPSVTGSKGGPAGGSKGGAFCAGGGKGPGWGGGGGCGGVAPQRSSPVTGGGKGKSAESWKPASEGMLYPAISEAVASMAEFEKDYDAQVLEKKLRGYFNKGSKNMDFKGKLNDLINEYADNVMSSIVAGFGDRDWLYSGQVDFVLVLDAAIKDSFPGFLLRGVKQEDFEQLVLGAYERAFDEQRFFPMLSEAVGAHVNGPKTKKKVWNAVDRSRKKTVSEGIVNVEDFTHTWITSSVGLLDELSQGGLEGCLTSAEMTQFFTSLLEQGGLPAVLTQEAQAPVGIVSDVVNAAYIEHCGGAGAPAAKKIKGALANWGIPDYGGKGAAYYEGKAAGIEEME